MDISGLLTENAENPSLLEMAESAKTMESFLATLEVFSKIEPEECRTVKQIIYP